MIFVLNLIFTHDQMPRNVYHFSCVKFGAVQADEKQCQKIFNLKENNVLINITPQKEPLIIV